MRFLAIPLCVASLLFLTGFGQQPLPPGIMGHNESQDVFWDVLASAPVTLDSKKGIYTISFPKQVQEFEGTLIKISGFFLAVETTPRPRRFALSRRNMSCPFCPPSKLTEVIEVMASRPVTPVAGEMMIVEGRLKLVEDGTQGLFYRLEGAVVK